MGTKNKFKYTGEAMDPNTGFYYLRARYYDPTMGRFISRDPVPGNALFPQTLNRYVYVINNPVLFTDSSGLAPDSVSPVARTLDFLNIIKIAEAKTTHKSTTTRASEDSGVLEFIKRLGYNFLKTLGLKGFYVEEHLQLDIEQAKIRKAISINRGVVKRAADYTVRFNWTIEQGVDYINQNTGGQGDFTREEIKQLLLEELEKVPK